MFSQICVFVVYTETLCKRALWNRFSNFLSGLAYIFNSSVWKFAFWIFVVIPHRDRTSFIRVKLLKECSYRALTTNLNHHCIFCPNHCVFKQHELVRNIHGSSQPSVTWTVNNDLKAVGKSLTSFFPSALCENEGSAKKRKKKNSKNSCVMPWHCWIRPDSSSTAKSHSSWIHFIKSAFNFKKETCCGWVELFKVRALACQSCASLPPNIWAPVWQKIQNQAQYWEPDISLCPARLSA